MKISPMATAQNTVQGDPQAARAASSVRSLRMNVSRTPGAVPASQAETAPADDTLPKTAPTEGATEATQPLSPQMAALAKARRALQQERQAFEQEKAALKSQPNQVQGIDPARLKSDTLRVLLEAGVSYDDLTAAILSDPNNTQPEIMDLKAQIAALESGFNQKLADKDAQAEKAVLDEMRREATRLSADGEDFELIRTTGSIDHVVDLIEKTYRESGEVLDVREAMGLVENELIEESLKLVAAKKVQGKLAPPLPQTTAPQQRPMTLTNRDTATPPMTRKERALAAFRGQLPK